MIFSIFPGRVHAAVVSKINEPQRSVTVEWYERGETKGKEVELDALVQLNPEVLQEQHAAPEPEPKKPAHNLQTRVTTVSIIVLYTAMQWGALFGRVIKC